MNALMKHVGHKWGGDSSIYTDEDYQNRLRARCVVDDKGCWLYQGFVHPTTGYGEMSYRGKTMRAHRAAFVMFKGPIPEGLDVCHSCDTRRCCNPDHLWAGTNEQNLHDASDKGRHHCQLKTHCPQGHPYDEQNTLWIKTKSYTGIGRQCKTCNRERGRRRYRQLRQQSPDAVGVNEP